MEGRAVGCDVSSVGIRAAAATLALVAEALWLTATFEAPDASSVPQLQWLVALFNDAYHRRAAILVGAAFLLLASHDIRRTLGVLRDQVGYLWWPWVAAHGVALLSFALLTSIGFGTFTGVPALSVAWAVAWIAAGTLTFAFWLLVLAPAAAWLRVLRLQWLNLVLALAVSAAAWAGGLVLQNLWEPLAAGTLRLSGLILSLIHPGAWYDPADGLEYGRVGTESFVIEIYPVCSGYEGIALVTVFVAAYLWIFRKDLAFPRALALFPIGIVTIWLANVLRVTVLILVGTFTSPEVAAQGLHSQAGWIGFTLVTLGLIAISHRWLSSAPAETGTDSPQSRRPELPLLLPLIALMATSMIVAATSAGFSTLYPIGVVITGAVLWHYRAAYHTLFGSWSWEPFAIGTLVFAVWVLFVPTSSGEGPSTVDRLAAWPAWLATGWILFRVLGSVVTVPLAEELAFRGYLIRKLVAKDFEQVRPGHFTWFSFVTSSLLFGLLHQHLLAGAIAGAAFALALYRRGLVGDAILAHMTSNALIAVAVLAAGQWGFWA